ncbi:MAG: DNA alkylation repair protein [Planctomycetia bacterium]|nr:DNA alkylation repair protein [Planctomycetia bacterium]
MKKPQRQARQVTDATNPQISGEITESEIERQVVSAIAALKRRATKRTLDGMARFAIPADRAFGVTVADIRLLAKRLGRDHALAGALWKSGWYEARMLAAFVAEPAKLTAAEMDRWCRDFDNWAICDTVCFHLFDRTPLAWKKLAPWSKRKPEFEKRAAFALLWGLSVHDKEGPDASFIAGLRLVEAAANDDRNFVKKAVNMALRAVGKRNAALHGAAIATGQSLTESANPTARWTGKGALRELKSASVARRLAAGKRTK